MPNRLTIYYQWDCLPDNLLLSIFSYLEARSILNATQTCKSWHRVGFDEFLWRDLFHWKWKLKERMSIAPGSDSWFDEYKRLEYHTPCIESEELTAHRNEVLHVSYSHNGEMFATSSKDGHIKVWSSTFPASVLYYADMKDFAWKYTQYSQFNSTDKLLLVSGVHFGSSNTSGEIAVFSLVDQFELKCRVLNKPYDIFGTWYNENHLLSGNLHLLGELSSCSALWLNKAYQELESAHESVVMRMFRFCNVNASTIRSIIVAHCKVNNTSKPCCEKSVLTNQSAASDQQRKRKGSESTANKTQKKINSQDFCEDVQSNARDVDDMSEDDDVELLKVPDDASDVGVHGVRMGQSIQGISEHVQSTMTHMSKPNVTHSDEHSSASTSKSSCSRVQKDSLMEHLLIFTTGTLTYTPHQIGIKHIKDAGADLEAGQPLIPPVSSNRPRNYMDPGEVIPDPDLDLPDQQQTFDSVDHLIELHGHIIGMCLSPDQRFLYVNCRPWPQNYLITEPLIPPPIAQEIDIHVIDLHQMVEVGTMHHAHKAYTPNDDCFFIFLDVCKDYVASGAEDNHGYLWDRHYRIALNKYPHKDVVNSVAFNPIDPETMITTSDDFTLKVWRSKNRIAQLKRDAMMGTSLE